MQDFKSKFSGVMCAEFVLDTNTAQKQFVTWGPDFIGEEQFNTDGVFHISGPVLVQNSPYSIVVSIVANSNR